LPLTEGNEVVGVRFPGLRRDVPVQPFVLEEQDRIIRPCRGLNESLRIFRVTWKCDVPSRRVRKQGFNTGGMKWSAFDPAARCDSNDKGIRPGPVAAPAQR